MSSLHGYLAVLAVLLSLVDFLIKPWHPFLPLLSFLFLDILWKQLAIAGILGRGGTSGTDPILQTHHTP